jgi:hypothetical protein
VLVGVSDMIRPGSFFSRTGQSGRAEREKARRIDQRCHSRLPACIQYVAQTLQVGSVKFRLVRSIAGDECRAMKDGPTALHLSCQTIGVGEIPTKHLNALRRRVSGRPAYQAPHVKSRGNELPLKFAAEKSSGAREEDRVHSHPCLVPESKLPG